MWYNNRSYTVLYKKYFAITKLQSGCRGQAAPPFKQLLCGRPHWGARKERMEYIVKGKLTKKDYTNFNRAALIHKKSYFLFL